MKEAARKSQSKDEIRGIGILRWPYQRISALVRNGGMKKQKATEKNAEFWELKKATLAAVSNCAAPPGRTKGGSLLNVVH